VNTPRPSGPATAGYYLVTALLVLAVAFGSLLVVSTTVGALRGGEALLGGPKLAIDAALPADHLKSLPPGVRVRDDAKVRVEVDDPTSAQLLLSTGTRVGPLALLIAALWLLRGLARSVREGEPFGSANVRRLRTLGFLLLVGYPAVELVNWALRLALTDTAPLSDLTTPGLTVQAAPLLAALGAFVLAEVFARGAGLREDVEATI
jgi:Protein of unknown function (DUF2975)